MLDKPVRQTYIDNLRLTMIILVLMVHAVDYQHIASTQAGFTTSHR